MPIILQCLYYISCVFKSLSSKLRHHRRALLLWNVLGQLLLQQHCDIPKSPVWDYPVFEPHRLDKPLNKCIDEDHVYYKITKVQLRSHIQSEHEKRDFHIVAIVTIFFWRRVLPLCSHYETSPGTYLGSYFEALSKYILYYQHPCCWGGPPTAPFRHCWVELPWPVTDSLWCVNQRCNMFHVRVSTPPQPQTARPNILYCTINSWCSREQKWSNGFTAPLILLISNF